jgi:hypothetical protein
MVNSTPVPSWQNSLREVIRPLGLRSEKGVWEVWHLPLMMRYGIFVQSHRLGSCDVTTAHLDALAQSALPGVKD